MVSPSHRERILEYCFLILREYGKLSARDLSWMLEKRYGKIYSLPVSSLVLLLRSDRRFKLIKTKGKSGNLWTINREFEDSEILTHPVL